MTPEEEARQNALVSGFISMSQAMIRGEIPRVDPRDCYSDHGEDIRTKGSCDICGGTE